MEAIDWGLTFDRSKRTWKFRPTIDRGTKKVGKRINVALSGCISLEDAILCRDAVVIALAEVGMRVTRRSQQRPVKRWAIVPSCEQAGAA
jgi:hypothetical protein